MADENALLKVIVAGDFSSGKSTFIQTISEETSMDVGIIRANDTTALYLFGLGGARRFDSIWATLLEGCHGFVLMIDSHALETFRTAKGILLFCEMCSPAPGVVAANFQDHPDAWSPEDLRIALHIPNNVPIVPCVATDRESVKNVLIQLLHKLLETLDDNEA